jgi:hypothetical protein
VQGSASWLPVNNPYWYQVKDTRKTKNKQLWMAGCSFANGNGVSADSRYGQIIADAFELPVSWLTLGGTSIDWAADQIIRANILPGDLVVWGITGVNRRAWFDDNGNMYRLGAGAELIPGFFSSTIGKIDRNVQAPYLIDLLTDRSNVYHAIRSIMQVIELSKKLKFDLVMIAHTELSLPADNDMLEEFLLETDGYVAIPKQKYVDLGNDNYHPGPVQHQLWADHILKHLKR